MKKNICVLWLCLIVTTVFSQRIIFPADPEAGIVEHVSDTISLDLKFNNEKNQEVTLRQIIDKPTVLSFVYFDCPGMCSPLLNGLSNVIEKSELELGKDYKVITISFNYRDNPQKAKEKKEKFLQQHSKNNAEHWSYLTTDSATIFKITDEAGFKVKPVDSEFVHASAILILSSTGQITRYLHGISYSPFDFKMALNEAKMDKDATSRIMLYCFHYNTERKHYVFNGSCIIIMAVLVLLVCAVVFIKKRKNKNQKAQ